MERSGLEIRGIWYNYVEPLTRDLFDYLESEIDYSRSSLNFSLLKACLLNGKPRRCGSVRIFLVGRKRDKMIGRIDNRRLS